MSAPWKAAAAAMLILVPVAALVVVARRSREEPAPPPPSADPGPVVVERAVLGAGSCTSSGCHAAAIDRHEPWRSSFTVWSGIDPHARAHRILFEPLAARIVERLAAREPGRIVVPPPEHPGCIGCHATGRGPLAAEGVSCESCHGPAGDWLAAHTLPGWKTAGNGLGMVDLGDPFTCARTCAECHVGGAPTADGAAREVSHDLIAAGHPRLAFELRSSKRAEPPHWSDRFMAPPAGRETVSASTSPAQPAADPLDEWALGRLGSLRAFLERVSRLAAAPAATGTAATEGVWPEFSSFECYGCHQPAVPTFDRAPGDRPATVDSLRGTPRLEPFQWAVLDGLLPAAPAAALAGFRTGQEGHWWQRPGAAAIADALEAVDAARDDPRPPWRERSAAEVAATAVAAVDPSRWDDAAACLALLEALVDRGVVRGASPAAVDDARTRLADVRSLLEFDLQRGPDGVVRFDSPRGHDAAGLARALDAAAEAVGALP